MLHDSTTESLAVKEFVRSAAGCDPAREEWLRPPIVLLGTIDYLIRSTDKLNVVQSQICGLTV